MSFTSSLRQTARTASAVGWTKSEGYSDNNVGIAPGTMLLLKSVLIALS